MDPDWRCIPYWTWGNFHCYVSLPEGKCNGWIFFSCWFSTRLEEQERLVSTILWETHGQCHWMLIIHLHQARIVYIWAGLSDWLRFPPSPLWLNCQAIFQPRNIWTPSKVKRASMPVMVYNFGGGLCSGYAGNPYFNGFLVLIRSHVSRCLHQAKRRDVSSGGTIVILLDSR